MRSLACINHSQQRVKLKEKAQLLTIWTVIGYTCVWFLSCKVTCCMIHVKICWILCSIVFVFSFLTPEHLWVSYNLLQVNYSVLLHVFLGRFGRASRLQNLKRLEKYTKTHWAKLWKEWWPQNLFLFVRDVPLSMCSFKGKTGKLIMFDPPSPHLIMKISDI